MSRPQHTLFTIGDSWFGVSNYNRVETSFSGFDIGGKIPILIPPIYKIVTVCHTHSITLHAHYRAVAITLFVPMRPAHPFFYITS